MTLAQFFVLHYAQIQIGISLQYFFNCRLFGCYRISGFPLFPRALPNIDFTPILIGAVEMLHAENGLGCDGDECCFGDGVVGPLGFGLGIFKCFGVLGDYLAFEMVTLHIFL